jgi:hypothetical protein
MDKMGTIWLMAAIIGIVAACGAAFGDCPYVPDGYGIEVYVGGFQNVNSIAFSPGGEFGYAGQLFVGDARPDRGTIYRVPSLGEKIFFANAHANLLLWHHNSPAACTCARIIISVDMILLAQ